MSDPTRGGARAGGPPLPEAFARHQDAMSTGNLDGYDALWTPDAVVEFPFADSVGTAGRVEGVEAITAYMRAVPETIAGLAFSDYEMTPSAPGSGPVDVVIEYVGRGTVARSGRPYEQRFVTHVRTDADGRIAHYREYWDPTRFRAARGDAS